MCSDSASLISFSESGMTSQNVSVKSNGVCAIEQKFAYVRGAVELSSGTIVKLICLGWSAMPQVYAIPSVLPHDADHHTLHLDVVGIDEDRLHGRIRRLQADFAAGIPVKLLERHVRPAEQRDHHFAVVSRLAILDDDEVAVANLLVDHRVAADAEHVRVSLADQILRHCDRLVRGDGLDGGAGRHVTEQREFDGPPARAGRLHLHRPAPVPVASYEYLLLQISNVLVIEWYRRKAYAE